MWWLCDVVLLLLFGCYWCRIYVVVLDGVGCFGCVGLLLFCCCFLVVVVVVCCCCVACFVVIVFVVVLLVCCCFVIVVRVVALLLLCVVVLVDAFVKFLVYVCDWFVYCCIVVLWFVLF